MNTPTHLLVACALLSRVDQPRRNLAVAAGALIPDLTIFVFYAVEKLAGTDERAIWSERYWTEPWQTLGAISNSVPLILVILAAGLALRAPIVKVFAFAALSHLALDFLFHANDAHRHFWPLTDWRFHAPISYWDSDHHGAVGRLIDLALLAGSAVILWRRFPGRRVRQALVFVALSFIGTGIYFSLAFG